MAQVDEILEKLKGVDLDAAQAFLSRVESLFIDLDKRGISLEDIEALARGERELVTSLSVRGPATASFMDVPQRGWS